MSNKGDGTKTIKADYRPRQWQIEAQEAIAGKRYSTILLHRRAGKTVFNVMQSIVNTLNCPYKNPVSAYIGPTRDQTKKTAWAYYKEFLAPLISTGFATFNETDLSIKFKNGAYIYLLSYENPDNIRGMYLDHVVMDEYQLAGVELFDKIIRPMLIDRKGKVIFSGTPAGRNQLFTVHEKGRLEDNWGLYRADWNQTDVIPESEKIEIRQSSTEEAINQEYLLDFDASNKGSFFGSNITRLRSEERVLDVLHDPAAPVVTGWDIGFDGTCIWYLQKQKDKMVVIDVDYYENEDLTHGANLVMNKPYTYAYQLLPHDGNDRNIMDKKKTPKGQLQSLGLKVKVVKRVGLMSAINSGRILLDKCCFSKKAAKKKLKLGNTKLAALDALALYEAAEDKKEGVLRMTEKHNRYSHIGSAWRTMGEGLKENALESNSYSSVLTRKKRPTSLVNNNWNPFKR
jgi:hypothetical protein